MTATTTSTETYERLNAEDNTISPADTDAGQSPKQRTPYLLMAGTVLFAANVLIAGCIWFAPELRVNMYGEDVESSSSYFRPSPFTETVNTAKAQKPKQAAKVRPVLFEDSQWTEFSQSADLLLPRSTQPAATTAVAHRPEQPVSGQAVQQVVESYSEFPRVTASMNTLHAESVEVAPRRVSERPVIHVSSND